MRFIRYILLALLMLGWQWGFSEGMTDSLRVKKPVKDSVFTLAAGPQYLLEPADVLEEGMVLTHAGDSTEFWINKCRSTVESVRKANKYIKTLDAMTEFSLPVGIGKYVDGLNYDFVISEIRLLPTHAELDVFLSFKLPNKEEELMFMARGIKYTKKGGIVGDATLQLITDYKINENGNKIQLILKADQTFATVDCDGFQELGIGADVKFSRDLLVPENEDGSIGEGNVVASFNTVISGWNDLIVQLTMPRFQMKGLQGVSFGVYDAICDFSDSRNAPNMVFPKDYHSTLMLPDNPNLWRGFYLKELSIRLPQEFTEHGSTARTSFSASNVIIDNMGLTGDFEAENLISLERGDMNGWAFSLTELHVDLVTNQIVEAGFSGQIVIPISGKDTPFDYSAVMTGDNYLFHVASTTTMNFPLWNAGEVEIYEGSYLDVSIENHKFLPKANLNGKMNIKASLSKGGQGVQLANITFENLELQTVKPYLSVGAFSFGSELIEQKMAGFPVSITDIGLRNVGVGEVGLDFNLKLNLVKEGDGGFAADAGLTIIGELNQDAGWQSWKFKDVQVRDISVDIVGAAYKIQGSLAFYREDPIYGDGFNGTVNAQFEPGIKIRAGAIFGSVNGSRYWYADGLVTFSKGIPIFTGVSAFGFGGGIFYGVKIDKEGKGNEKGRTASGVTYIPDERSGIGLKAIVVVGTSSPNAFNAEVFFEIAFFKGGGVRYIAFGGNGKLVSDGLELSTNKIQQKAQNMNQPAASSSSDGPGAENTRLLDAIFGSASEIDAALAARVFIEYDFENRVLHGNFEVYVDVANGVIKGIGENNKAGWAVLHFGPDDWYIYIGTPDDRIGISVGIGSLRANATSYFMVGTKILGSPPPPPEVSRILGGMDLDYMKDLNAIGTGAGFAFGAALSVTTGDLTFLMFYARFDAGAGFDIMIKDYGDTRCEGRSGRIGINGWYANGQAYAYFEGSIGIKVSIFGSSKKIKILSIGAAAVLQAKLPNPFWMRGVVGGYFSILGGMVRGECKFQVTLGSECKIVRDANAVLDDLKIISELTPANGETQVNVFNSPQALFSIPVEKTFEIFDEVNKQKRSFRVKLDHFKVMQGSKELVGTLNWNATNDVVAFESYEILPSEKELVLKTQVSFEELKSGNWVPVLTNGKRVTEMMEQSFNTGKAPDYLPHENIEYCYPLLSQLNFYRNETRKGYIKLRKAMPDLFNPGPEWKQQGRFIVNDESFVTFDFKYDYSSNTVSYTIPDNLAASTIYTVSLVNVPANQSSDIDRNVKGIARKIDVEGIESGVEVASKKAEGSLTTLQEKTIYTSYLRTSPYATFVEKINSFNYTNGWTFALAPGVLQLNLTLNANEHFEKFELDKEVGRKASLIRLIASTDNTWYKDYVYPLVYEGYPLGGLIKLRRDRGTLDIPPTNAVFIRQPDGGQFTLKDDYVFSGWTIPWGAKSALAYDLSYEMAMDYSDMRSYGANVSLTTDSDRLKQLLTTPFPVLRTGKYKVKLQYVLPGINEVSSEKEITINYTGTYSGSN